MARFILKRDNLEGTIIDAKLKRYEKQVIYHPGGERPQE